MDQDRTLGTNTTVTLSSVPSSEEEDIQIEVHQNIPMNRSIEQDYVHPPQHQDLGTRPKEKGSSRQTPARSRKTLTIGFSTPVNIGRHHLTGEPREVNLHPPVREHWEITPQSSRTKKSSSTQKSRGNQKSSSNREDRPHTRAYISQFGEEHDVYLIPGISTHQSEKSKNSDKQ